MSITLTQTTFDRQLQIYTACAVKKGAMYIENTKAGKECNELLEESALMIGLIHAIECFDISFTDCVTNNEIQVILNKLKALCGLPCNTVINFNAPCLIWDQGGNALADQGGRICADEEVIE